MNPHFLNDKGLEEARQFLRRFDIEGKIVIEIGVGTGTLLDQAWSRISEIESEFGGEDEFEDDINLLRELVEALEEVTDPSTPRSP